MADLTRNRPDGGDAEAVESDGVSGNTESNAVSLSPAAATDATALPWRPSCAEADADARRFLDIDRGRFVWPGGDV